MRTTISITALVAPLLFGMAHNAAAQTADREQLAANFSQADSNGDGALTMDEFTAFVDLNAASGIGRSAMLKRSGRYSMAFGRLDNNSDGVISTSEMQALAQR